MKKLCVGICSCLALAGFAQQAVVAGGTTSEAAKVRALLRYQITQLNQARWRPLWQTYTPRVHSRCSYGRFVARMKVIRTAVGPVTTRNITIRIIGKRASVVYQMIGHGKVVGAATARNPDIYARLGDRWLDDVGTDSPCP